MKNAREHSSIREMIHDCIKRRVLPRIERDGISKLLLPEQITPDDCARPMKCPHPCYLRYRGPILGIGLTGKAPYCIDGKTFIFTPGKIIFMASGAPHAPAQKTIRFTENINLNRPASFLWLLTSAPGVRLQVLRVRDKQDVLEATRHFLLLDRHFGRLMTRLAEEVRSARHNYARIARGILIEFMERCLRAIQTAGVGRPPRALPTGRSTSLTTDLSGKADSKPLPVTVRSALEFIDSHYHAPISLDNIAEAAESSVTHLCRLFKAATGLSPIQYLIDVRITAAKELLLTDLKISEVAHLVGFDDISYFGRSFRKNNGASPRQYRQRMKKASRYRPPPAG